VPTWCRKRSRRTNKWVAAFLTVLGGAYNANELRRNDLPSDHRDLLNVTPRGPIGVEAGDHAATCRPLGDETPGMN
jgi:hypothetical protein